MLSEGTVRNKVAEINSGNRRFNTDGQINEMISNIMRRFISGMSHKQGDKAGPEA